MQHIAIFVLDRTGKYRFPYRDKYVSPNTYASAVGALLWLAAGTRPDLTYSVSLLARYCSNPGEKHYEALLRVLAYSLCSPLRKHAIKKRWQAKVLWGLKKWADYTNYLFSLSKRPDFWLRNYGRRQGPVFLMVSIDCNVACRPSGLV